jgi:hypothetical protein
MYQTDTTTTTMQHVYTNEGVYTIDVNSYNYSTAVYDMIAMWQDHMHYSNDQTWTNAFKAQTQDITSWTQVLEEHIKLSPEQWSRIRVYASSVKVIKPNGYSVLFEFKYDSVAKRWTIETTDDACCILFAEIKREHHGGLDIPPTKLKSQRPEVEEVEIGVRDLQANVQVKPKKPRSKKVSKSMCAVANLGSSLFD